LKAEKEKMLNGELYNAADPELLRERINVRRLTRIFNDSLETDDNKRTELLKELFGSTGKNLYIELTFRCDYGYNTHRRKFLC
jgi:maltose O-acetyltransferase